MWLLEWLWLKAEVIEPTHTYIPVMPVDPEPVSEPTFLEEAQEMFKFKAYIDQVLEWYDRHSVRRERRKIEDMTPARIHFHGNNVDVEKYLDKKHKNLLSSN